MGENISKKDINDNPNNLEIDKLKKELISNLKEVKCVKFGEFTLASGKKSNYYIDIKKATTNPKILKIVAKIIKYHLREQLDKNGNLKIAGVELGSVPIATAVSLETEKELLIIRKKPKDYGTKSKIEGELNEGDRVVIVEDVTTTGGSVLKAVDEIRLKGGIVKEIFVIVDRMEGALENLSSKNIKIVPLVTVDELK